MIAMIFDSGIMAIKCGAERMGFIRVNVGLSNPVEPEISEEVRVLVDTGATLSVFPASLLDRLGIRRRGQRRFRGFGGVVTRDVGSAEMRYAGETRP